MIHRVLLEGEWYDLRDLGNTVGELLDQIRDTGAPDWVPYVVASLIGAVGILLWPGCCSRWRTPSSCC